MFRRHFNVGGRHILPEMLVFCGVILASLLMEYVLEVIHLENITVTSHSILDKLAYKGVVMVEVNIAYPQISGDLPERSRREFNRYYQQEADTLYQHAKGELYTAAVEQYKYAMENGYPFNNYVLMQVYEVTYNAYPLLSLYMDVYEYTGGAHGNTNRTGNTWDLQKGKMLSMADLFVRGYDYTKPIFSYVETEAARREQSGEVSYFDDLTKNIHDYFDEKNFYLTPKGLAVFYPLYTIGPYYIGIQAFTVPYASFGSNMVYRFPS